MGPEECVGSETERLDLASRSSVSYALHGLLSRASLAYHPSRRRLHSLTKLARKGRTPGCPARA
jgi:hypothetical protein